MANNNWIAWNYKTKTSEIFEYVIDEDGVVDGVVVVDVQVEFDPGDGSVDDGIQPPQKCPAIYGNKL